MASGTASGQKGMRRSAAAAVAAARASTSRVIRDKRILRGWRSAPVGALGQARAHHVPNHLEDAFVANDKRLALENVLTHLGLSGSFAHLVEILGALIRGVSQVFHGILDQRLAGSARKRAFHGDAGRGAADADVAL